MKKKKKKKRNDTNYQMKKVSLIKNQKVCHICKNRFSTDDDDDDDNDDDNKKVS